MYDEHLFRPVAEHGRQIHDPEGPGAQDFAGGERPGRRRRSLYDLFSGSEGLQPDVLGLVFNEGPDEAVDQERQYAETYKGGLPAVGADQEFAYRRKYE